MKRFFYLTSGLLIWIICLNSIDAQTTLINYGANWSYYDNQQEPPAQSALEWEDVAYNDNTWSAGPAHLGYGDGDESTTISSSTEVGYFRHEFTVSSPGVYSDLDLNFTYDDGAVIYLNGVEVWRVNMPGGTISYSTFAASVSSENAQASTNIGNSLVSGTNVLAVEVHQASASSSDISFDFKLTGNQPGAVNVVRGPYLQTGTSTSVIIRWRTASATESIVDYGTTSGNLNQQVSNLTPKTEHELEITGLNPNTIYYYEISNSSAVLVPAAPDLYFKTSPNIGVNQPITAWILGDCGTANSDQRAVRDAYYNYIGSNHTDMILFLGDNAYNDGTDNQYQFAIFENMYEEMLKNTVSYSCLGNHDGYSADSPTQTGPYYDIFTFPTAGEGGGVASGTEAYYSFDYGNIHFICLDAYDTNRSVGGAMYNWCQNDIQSTTQEWIVAYWHHPPYTKGSHDSDSESNLIQMRENFLPMLESNGVDLVLGGHSHSYERSYFLNGHYGLSGTFNTSTHTVGVTGDGDGRIDGNGAYSKTVSGPEAGNGAVYITTGSAGKISGGSLNHPAMYYSANSLGSTIMEVSGNTMDVKFLRSDGVIADYLTIEKENACTPGTACDDGDACTTNDTYDVNCNCIGTAEPDSDGDGVCDAEDDCPADPLYQSLGQACNDNDPCTVNDMVNASCGCAGTPTGDSDGDGVCDALDQCPGQDDALIGQACDDGDICTINDIYDSNCGCSGTPLPDSDGDGLCDAIDPCSTVISDGFENGFGNWIDGGNDCSLSATNANTGSYSILIRDNSGTASSMYTGNLNLSSYDEVVFDFSFITSSMENNEDFFLEISTNGGSSYALYKEWNSGTEFNNNVRYNESILIDDISFTSNTRFRLRCDASANNDRVYIDDVIIEGCTSTCVPGTTCDDGDACTINDIYDVNCGCAGTLQDSDGDGVCDVNDVCPGFDDNVDSDGDGVADGCDDCPSNAQYTSIGQSCDDGDACTVNDVVDSNCNCTGTLQDSDGDGVCDGNDICPGFDDNIDGDGDGVPDGCDQCPGTDDSLIGTSCNDGIACTINDVYDANCNCVGTEVDADGDGILCSADPDDSDPCNPVPCNPCTELISDDFENGFGNWNDGGSDCSTSNSWSNSGLTSIRLRDNSGASSSMYSDNLNLAPYGTASVEFYFYANSMESGENFYLEVSTNGGGSYSIVQNWISGTNFNNNVVYPVSVEVSGVNFTTNTRFRIRCDASGNNDQVYIDDVSVSGCGAPVKGGNSETRSEIVETEIIPKPASKVALKFYPVPTSSVLNVDLSMIKGSPAEIGIYNLQGELVKMYSITENHPQVVELDVSSIHSGMYLITVQNDLLDYKVGRVIINNY